MCQQLERVLGTQNGHMKHCDRLQHCIDTVGVVLKARDEYISTSRKENVNLQNCVGELKVCIMD